jgi:hypothetical protein
MLLWYLYLHLDSDVFPIKTYGDLTERIFGRAFKHVVTSLQSIQLIVNVGALCLGLGLALSEIDRGSVRRRCFSNDDQKREPNAYFFFSGSSAS